MELFAPSPDREATMSTSFAARRFLLVAVIVLVSACGAAPGTPESGTTSAPRPNNSDVITRQELADPMLAGSTLLEAVRKLRPRFLNDRGGALGGARETVMISFNGSELLPLEELARVGVMEVNEIRYLNTAAAAQRFGMAGSNGPVLILALRAR
jgi:hypothetical protein